MAWSFVGGGFQTPFTRARYFIGPAATYDIILFVDRPDSARPILYADINPFSRFNPGVGGVGLEDHYHNYFPAYRRSQIRTIRFYGQAFIDIYARPFPGAGGAFFRVLSDT